MVSLLFKRYDDKDNEFGGFLESKFGKEKGGREEEKKVNKWKNVCHRVG